ncbi:NERD domain-containing protein [Phocea massiliensis]|uniref:NERD domain-containing protein n=1 Tax=Merdimmobilis hominis TaxID=2897707 RepID=A0A938X7N8_9FIRM|nr:nuclease-related domain-containing protein [Merdimmobilis hominis]MBM6921721.1 NERD domain-containing protein [Merdimmobilis hominis]
MEKYIPYIIAGGIVLLLVLILIAVRAVREAHRRKLGIDGEKKVAAKLKRFASIRSFKVINDLYLPLYDKTTQVDHVLIGFFGLLVIETKNIGGEVYGEPRKKDWLHIMGKSRYKLYNPLMQNQTHVDCIRHLLGKENIYNVPIESLVVFTNRKVELFIPKKLPIISFNRLNKFLHQERFSKDNNIDVDKIYHALLKYQITDKKVISQHVKNVKEMAKHNK